MKVSDPKYLKISKPPRAQVARMGRPHAESDSYYAAHYNRCVKEERERKGKTSADGRGMSLSAAAPARRPSPSPAPPPPQSGGSSKNFCLTMTISRQRHDDHSRVARHPEKRVVPCRGGKRQKNTADPLSTSKPPSRRDGAYCDWGVAFHRLPRPH